MQPWIIILIIVAVLVLFMIFLMVITRYKKCPPNKIMVIYGKVGTDKAGNNRSAKCIHGGAAFIWPLVQSYTYLDLTPLSISETSKARCPARTSASTCPPSSPSASLPKLR